MAYGDIRRLNTNTAQLGSTTAAVYTAPVGKRVQIGTIIFHNTGSVSRSAELFDNASTNNSRLLNITLATNETFEFSPKVPIVIEGAETLQGRASAASEVNIKIYGREDV